MTRIKNTTTITVYAIIKMGIFDKSNYIVNTGIIEQVFLGQGH